MWVEVEFCNLAAVMPGFTPLERGSYAEIVKPVTAKRHFGLVYEKNLPVCIQGKQSMRLYHVV